MTSGSDQSNDQSPLQATTPAQKFVPMSAREFERKQKRRVIMITSVLGAAILAIGFAVWKSSEPVAAGNAYEEATKLYAVAKYPEAILALDRAVDAKINTVESYMLRGTIRRMLNQPDRAIPDITAVIEAHPDDPELYRLRAQCYRDVGMIQRSIDDYDKLIKLKPSAMAYNGRGICYRDQGKLGQAIEDFSKAIELQPSVDNLLQRAMAQDSVGNHTKAIEDYNRVVELYPEMPYTYRARAYAKEATGDKKGAIADRERARSIEYPARASAAKPPKDDKESKDKDKK